MPKMLLGLSPEMDKILRYACRLEAMRHGKETIPRGPYVESILAKSVTIQRAARAVGVKIPKRIPDARGRYPRK